MLSAEPVREAVRVQVQGTILLIGDGTVLLTEQEIGTRLREDRSPLVVVISNDAIHGPAERYSGVPQWNWSLVPTAMGGQPARILRAGTLAELTATLETTGDPQGLVLLEAVLPKTDLPEALRALTRALASANAPANGPGQHLGQRPADAPASKQDTADATTGYERRSRHERGNERLARAG